MRTHIQAHVYARKGARMFSCACRSPVSSSVMLAPAGSSTFTRAHTPYDEMPAPTGPSLPAA